MKTLRIAVSFLLVLLATAATAESDSQKSFAALKTLAGSWTGKGSQGQPVQVSYRVTSGGSALMSEIQGEKEDMVSMFHPDGDRLLMTHYCEAGNQPRMVGAASPDGKTITFNFQLPRRHQPDRRAARTHGTPRRHPGRCQPSHRGLGVHQQRRQQDARGFRPAAQELISGWPGVVEQLKNLSRGIFVEN